MPHLAILGEGDTETGKVPLPVGRPFIIGRGAGSSLRLRDVKLSRLHCEVSVSDGITVLTDLGSTNGTYLNGKRIVSTAVKDGDIIQVGYTRLQYRQADAAGGPWPKPKAAAARAAPPPAPPKSVPGPAPVKPGAPARGKPTPPSAPAAASAARREAPPAPAAAPKPGPPPLPSAAGHPGPPRVPEPTPEPAAKEPEGPDDRAIVELLRIVVPSPARALKKGEVLCASCREPVGAKELKAGPGTNVHGQVCCARCVAGDPLLGKTVAGYRIEAKLGHSAWSATYKAEQLSMARPVVLRVVRLETAGDSELVTQFLASVKRGGQISHPNLVRIYDIGRADEICYVSAEYIDGESLAQVVPRKPGLSVENAVQVMLDVAGAVDVAHRRDVFHRDIRPSNIILNDEGIPKLAGLGFVRSIEEAAASRAPKLQHGADVVQYWAPECLVNPAQSSREADVYSLGAVLYALLAGRPPFDSADAAGLVRLIRRVRPKPLDTIRSDVPHRLGAVVAKALAKAPADRYPDCQQLIQDLRGATA